MKTCTKCGETKELSEFSKDKCGRDGIRPYCKKCDGEACRKYQKANPDKIKEYNHKYYEADPERAKERVRRWREDNSDKAKERMRKWRGDNPERVKKLHQMWCKANPEKAKARTQKRRAKKAGLEGHFTAEEWRNLCDKYDNKCLCCGKKKKLHADHIIPITWEGSTNNIENIQCLCGRCNQRKGNRHATDYRQGVMSQL